MRGSGSSPRSPPSPPRTPLSRTIEFLTSSTTEAPRLDAATGEGGPRADITFSELTRGHPTPPPESSVMSGNVRRPDPNVEDPMRRPVTYAARLATTSRVSSRDPPRRSKPPSSRDGQDSCPGPDRCRSRCLSPHERRRVARCISADIDLVPWWPPKVVGRLLDPHVQNSRGTLRGRCQRCSRAGEGETSTTRCLAVVCRPLSQAISCVLIDT